MRLDETVAVPEERTVDGHTPTRERLEGGLRFTDPARRKRSAPLQPLVSYVTVVRNAAATLERTLRSVREQCWSAVEHIVVDGMSDDGTRDIIQAHAAQIDHYVSEPDAGLYPALNKALAMVRGDLVCVLNADDWLTPDAAAVAARTLLRCASSAATTQPLLILTSAWLHHRGRRKLWLPGPLNAGSWLRCPKICHNAAYATPAALALAGGYDTRFRIVADTRWLCGAFDAGVQVVHNPAPTVHYASGGLSSDLERHVQECALIVAQRFAALSEAEVWALMHSFYPWQDNLEPFAATRPRDLGQALQALLARHAHDEALQASAAAAGLAEQRGHALRVKPQRALSDQLQRGLWRAWYGARDMLAR